MGWFSGKQLPTTSYGYTPPPGATASGWVCYNDGCGTGDMPAPKRWPMQCPLCGGPADPEFDQPWRDESEGPRLRALIAHDGDAYGIYTGSLYGWQFGQALRKSVPAARQAVTEALAWRQRFNAAKGVERDDPRSLMFWYAWNNGHVALAGELLGGLLSELDYEAVDYTDIDESWASSKRGTYLGIVNMATTLLETPEARALPQAPAIDRAARYIGSATQHAMGVAPVKYQWQELMRRPELR